MEKEKTYYPAVDGLRIIAVLSVLLYHLIPNLAPGGFYGVVLFLVISGYFSTKRLLREWDKFGKVNLIKFYKSRFKRLFPSVAWLLVLSSCVLIFLGSQYLIDFRGVFISSIFQVNNWWQIFAGKSYFEQMGAPSPYNHLWYLGILGQLYLLFPIFFGIVIHYFKTGKKMFYLLIGIILSSSILMGVLYFLDDNLNRVYYGTDTRLFSFFFGVLLAVAKFSLDQHKKRLSVKVQYVFLFLSLAGMIYLTWSIYDYQVFNYTGGMLLFSFLSSIALWSVLDPRNRFNRWCDHSILSYLSTRSFQIYLWQYPLIIVYDDYLTIQSDYYWLHIFIKVVLILFFSEISYQLIQVKGFEWFKIVSKQPKFTIKKVVLLTGTLILFTLTGYSLVLSPEASGFEEQMQEEFRENQEKIENRPVEITEQHPFEEELLEKGYTELEIQEANNVEAIAVGDSILLNIAPELNEIFPKAMIDADVGRQLYNSYEVFQTLQSENPDVDSVIIILGSNGNFKKSDLEDILTLFTEETDIYIVNTTVPKAWQTSVNQTLSEVANEQSNVKLIDWANLSQGYHSEWFYEDGTHMNEAGRQVLTQMIADTILGN